MRHKPIDLFTLMSFHMIVKVTLCDEGRVATELLAGVGSETGVGADVSFQISLLIEPLSTIVVGADERSGTPLY